MESQIVEGLLPSIPASKHTAAFKIFNYHFRCRVAAMHLNSEEFIRDAGTLTTGNAAMDRGMAMQMLEVPLTIAAIAMYVGEGANVEIIIPEDTGKIYRIIEQHLNDWFDQVSQNLHGSNPPTDDLRLLDQTAAFIYPYARYHLQKIPFHGQFNERLTQVLGRRVGIGRSNRPSIADLLNTKPDLPQQHTPMADNITREAMSRRKAWDSKTPR